LSEVSRDRQMKAKVGIYVCECGPNIAEKVDMDRILAELSELGDYKDIELVVKKYGFLCSGQGQQFLEEEIAGNGFTHLVIGACSPRDHDSTFMGVCGKADLNPYLYKLVNIREHCTWVIDDIEKATDKAITYIHAGISRVLHQTELFEKPFDINPDTLVIGGGITGLEAALSLSSDSRRVFLVEKADRLGGRAGSLAGMSFDQSEGADFISDRIDSVNGDRNITVLLNTEVSKVIGFLGNFEIELSTGEGDGPKDIMVGAIVTATGCMLYDPSEDDHFSYSGSDEVYTSESIGTMFAEEGRIELASGEQPSSVALVHCVGRNDRNYCSGICCGYMMRLAGLFRQQSPEIEITEFYRDICLPGKNGSDTLRAAENAAVSFVRVKDIQLNGTSISFEEIDGQSKDRTFDMVVLAPALIPSTDAGDLSELLGISLDETGFFAEAHRMINPSGTSTDGVFVAGTAHGPSGLVDSMRFARAASGQILTRLIPGEKLIPEVMVSEVMESYCTGCGNCLDVCVYGAIYADDSKGVSVINEAVCRGCGNCFGSCPSGALRTKHFTNAQIYREVDEALR